MKIKATRNMLGFNASVLRDKFGLSVNKAREFKLGKEVDVSQEVANKLADAGMTTLPKAKSAPANKKGVNNV